jgi:TonB family protein
MSHNRWLVLCVLFLPVLCLASLDADLKRAPSDLPVDQRHPQMGKSAVRKANFADVPHTVGHSRCEISKAPEPLATPDPVLENLESTKVTISFIVGTDGRVHSAFILQSAGSKEDRAVLQTVRWWRYRPAMCNGVPTESEAKVQFSSQ